jgi:hypothetical protein
VLRQTQESDKLAGLGKERNKMAGPDPTLKLAVVFESADPVALGIAKAALEDAGIEFAETDEALTGYGFSPIINPVGKIQVAQSREGQALEILKDLIGAADAETGVGSPDAEIDVVGPSGSGER